MGGLVILHPLACLKDHPDNLFYTPMKSRRTVKFNHNLPPPATMASKNFVMGQVKILKRGELLEEPSTILKEVTNCNMSSDSSPKVALKTEATVSNQMKNMTEFYAGYGFVDSPPPSLVPLPTFSIRASTTRTGSL
ncbi:hypothetical protein L1987_81389 [Smallanthus sonchifolius]|uniref:Uncharacterized protein n=1 Tax=Smallanthus sonchifolius TaxID=185202 RepID=A0ACB8YQJ2_9ASTR|nr:hypothetical protein L1987_81389 [Smallanthus sonchifolius]